MSGEWAGQGWLAWGSQSRPRWWRSTPSHASAPAWSRRLSPVWGTSSPRPKYIVVCTTTITIGNTDMGLITIHCKHHHLSEGISNAGMGFCRWCKRSDLHMQVLSQVLQVQYFLSVFSLKMLLTAHKSTWYLGSADERNSSSCGRQKINFVKVEEWSVDAKFTPGPMHTVCNQASGLILVTRSEALRVCPRTQTNDITRKGCYHIRSFPSIDI